MLELWSGRTRFIDDPRIALDNNTTVRALRDMVIGRKNHYGSRSKRGTAAGALFYSLIDSAQLCGVGPEGVSAVRDARAARESWDRTLPHALPF